jgi:hypothetical protein
MSNTPIERRTTTSNNTPVTSNKDTGPGVNVLHKYRSFTYNFTLAALRKAEAFDPKTYRDSTLDLVILKSGGKGPASITPNVVPVDREEEVRKETVKTETKGIFFKKTVTTVTTSTETVPYKDYSGSALVQGFNENSPGRFDMFIDNIEIETLMTAGGAQGVSQPTTLTFDVVEPYSINGFVEALHVASIAAGYPTYTQAVFVLKMEFCGYADDDSLSPPVVEPKGTRYFPITLTGLEVTIDEKGTKYQVKAIAANERGFGNPSEIKKSVKISGGDVKSILTNLVDGVTKQAREENAEIKKNKADANQHDIYKVKFPSWVEGKGWDNAAVNKIGQAKVTELLKDNALYKFPDPGEERKPTANQPKGQQTPTPQQNAKQPESFKLEPTNPVAQFSEGKNIHECITAIIKDSKYVRDIVEKLSSPSEWRNVVDDNDMVDYFMVKLEVENQEAIDLDKKRPYQIFTYVVTPYKILYTRIPNYGSEQIDIEKLTKLCQRQYNYIYTGNNLDIINFKLNFNTLFFEALPTSLGNTKSPPSREAAAPGNNSSVQRNPPKLQDLENRGLPAAPVQSTARDTSVDRDAGNQTQRDPYYAMAKSMHSAITDSKASMLTGEVDILGDPFYLVTGGIGNYNPEPESKENNRTTKDGEATFNYGEVLIRINFRNPIDIQPLKNGGTMFFDPKLVPFSGVYRVTKAKSTFKDGMFRQALEVIRQPGQPAPEEVPNNDGKNAPSNPSERVDSLPEMRDTVKADVTPAAVDAPGQRPDTINLLEQQSRSLPSPGLPGQLSNFTAATGGLGGTIPVASVSGAVTNPLSGITRLATQAYGGVVPGGLNQSAGGIRLQARAAVGLRNQVLSPAGLITQIGQSVSKSFGLTGAAGSLVNQVVGIATEKIRRSSVLGSGIGAGATVQFVTNTLSKDSTIGQQNQFFAEPVTAIPTTGLAQGLDRNTLAAVAGLGSGGSLVNNIGDKVLAVTQGNKTDPNAIASQYGINQSQLSGLSPNLQSKLIDQTSAIAGKVPADTDLGVATAQGVYVKGFGSEGLQNMPATAPYSTAPLPAPDSGFLNRISASGGPRALASAFGVNDVSQISQNQISSETIQDAVSSTPPAYQSPTNTTYGNKNIADTVASGLKYLTANNQLASLTGLAGTREGQLLALQNRYPGSPINIVGDLGTSAASKFGSKTSGKSPLDKIMIR